MTPTPNRLSQYHVFLASPGDVGAERQYVRRFFEPNRLSQYHVFLASPGDVGAERQYVRRFFDEYNHHTYLACSV
jgi:hypothetical protein